METVVSCQKIKEVNGKAVYAVGLSDGQGGESFAQEIAIGTPVSELEISQSQWGLKIKKKSTGGSGAGGWGGKRSGNESFALSYAKDLVVGGKVDIKNILPTADKLYAWLEGKKATAQATPPAPANGQAKAQGAIPATLPATDDLPF